MVLRGRGDVPRQGEDLVVNLASERETGNWKGGRGILSGCFLPLSNNVSLCIYIYVLRILSAKPLKGSTGNELKKPPPTLSSRSSDRTRIGPTPSKISSPFDRWRCEPEK